MKLHLSGQAQAELIKITAVVLAGGLGLYLGQRAINGTIKSIKDTANAIWEAPAHAVQAIKEAARSGGQTWLDGYTDSQASGTPPVGGQPRYKNPLVNDQGMDFGQLSA